MAHDISFNGLGFTMTLTSADRFCRYYDLSVGLPCGPVLARFRVTEVRNARNTFQLDSQTAGKRVPSAARAVIRDFVGHLEQASA